MNEILPETLKCWQSASLITAPSPKGYSEPQVAEIRVIRALTSAGDTLTEIRMLLNDSWLYRHSGWKLRQQEFIIHLQFGTDETRAYYLWKLYTRYSPKDIFTFLLTPVVSWLCNADREVLRSRAVSSLQGIVLQLIEENKGREHVKPLLQIAEIMKQFPSSIPRRSTYH